jgi:LuxR family maltose regulon positive regulatory protein
MTMTFSLHENFEFNGVDIYNESASAPSDTHQSFTDEIRLFTEKLQIQKFKNDIERPRLMEVLEKSSVQFGSTLITGRAGTGKTALAAQYARKYKQVAWLSIDSADSEWKIFDAYLSACLAGNCSDRKIKKSYSKSSLPSESEVSTRIETLMSQFVSKAKVSPSLIVLDDAHYIFDSEWFGAFFKSLLYSLPTETHLLVLSRGVPSLPLWRLRSKQVLGVVDEKLLAFDIDETQKLFRKFGCSPELAAQAHSKSFGRISHLKSFAKSQ